VSSVKADPVTQLAELKKAVLGFDHAHYPLIAGYVIGHQKMHEDRAEADMLKVANDLRDLATLAKELG
jgi:hypothetical protein